MDKFKKKYRQLRALLEPHPLFRTVDKIKLSKIKRGSNKSGFTFIKPKGFRHSIKIRRNYTDKEVVNYVLLDQYHMPSKCMEIPDKPVILDLGSNIGLTLVHFKHVYPNAKVIGYEMNKANFQLAERNTKFYNNIFISNKAVWTENTTVSYKVNSNFDAYSILNSKASNEKMQGVEEVQSISIPNIIKTHNLKYIDYLKMDIEGAEVAILQSGDLSWLDIVYAMNIEMHLDEDKKIDEYLKIIQQKGFKVWKDDKHWSSLFAVRE